MNKILITLIVLATFSCTTPQKKGTTTNATTKQTKAPKTVDPSILASASTMLNMTTGYWHIGGAITTEIEGGKEGYTGKWLKFKNDMTFIAGKDENDLFQGDWRYDDEHDLITLKSDTGKGYFLHEWNAKVVGDIIILIGNSPQNLQGGQIKLVRADTKVVDYNIN